MHCEAPSSTTKSVSDNKFRTNGNSRSNINKEFQFEPTRPEVRPGPKGSVAAVVLGGGENDSRRLFPLTSKRTLPAIPLAGQYRCGLGAD